MHLRWLPAVSVLFFGFGCEPNPPPADISSGPSIGHLQYAIGSDVRKISFGEVRCSADGDAVMVELVSNRVVHGPQGVGQRPRVLIARVRGDEVLEAHAFAYGVSHQDIRYTMLQFVAKDVPGSSPAECRAERAGESVKLACNDTTIVGWRAPGEPPRPAFQAEWEESACQGGG